jgi:hypothetical protein
MSELRKQMRVELAGLLLNPHGDKERFLDLLDERIREIVNPPAVPDGWYETDEAGTIRPMKPPSSPPRPARTMGFTGDICDQCGNATMRQAGKCLTCQTCGTTTGCS